MKNLVKTFDLNIKYCPKLYNYLRKKNEIKQASGEERKRIIKQANGDLTECKKIQFFEYFKKNIIFVLFITMLITRFDLY